MSPYIHEAVPHRRKRVRFSPNSSSEPSVSDLASTTATSSTTNASEYDSDGDSSEPSESSENPSSSEDSSSEDEEDEEGEDTEMEDQASPNGVVNLRANRGKKPVMKLREDEDLGPDIRGFLKDFLPKLKKANEELERQREAGTLKSLDAGGEEEGEPYIEMDLGLGVLEEKDPDKESDENSASEAEDGGERDVLGKLLKREKREAAKIEVVQNETSS